MRTILKQVIVRSESDARRKYKVTFYKGGANKVACSCLGWTLHGERKDCKHIRALKATSRKGKVA